MGCRPLQAAAMALLAAAAFAQTAPSGPKFEVASIKPGVRPRDLAASGRTPGMKVDGARVDIVSLNLRALILDAYRIESYQLTGPDWMVTTPFDIQAKIPEGVTTDQVPAMLQALLAERFGLAVRHEPRQEPLYALVAGKVAGKDGPKLKPSPPGAATSGQPFPNRRAGRILLSLVQTDHGFLTYSMVDGKMLFEADTITMPELAAMLMHYVEIPVVDQTGLTGFYQITLPVPRGPNAAAGRGPRGAAGTETGERPANPADAASEPSGASIFASVEKLGLRLERRTAPIDHLIVEHVEKTPTEN
jgi:uncharacterized protein (TIGR03435 family)